MYAFFSDDRERLGRYIDQAIGSGDEWLVAVSWMMRAILAENDGEVDAAPGCRRRGRSSGTAPWVSGGGCRARSGWSARCACSTVT